MPAFEIKEDQKHKEVVCLAHTLEFLPVYGDLLALVF